MKLKWTIKSTTIFVKKEKENIYIYCKVLKRGIENVELDFKLVKLVMKLELFVTFASFNAW